MIRFTMNKLWSLLAAEAFIQLTDTIAYAA